MIGGIYHSKEVLLNIYSQKIGSNKELHKKIIETVKLADKQNLINFTFRSFILDELWLSLFEMVEKDKGFSKTQSI